MGSATSITALAIRIVSATEKVGMKCSQRHANDLTNKSRSEHHFQSESEWQDHSCLCTPTNLTSVPTRASASTEESQLVVTSVMVNSAT